MTKFLKRRQRFFFAALALMAIQSVALASAAGLPWESPLALILTSLTGPVALTIGAAGIIVIGGGMAFRPDIFEFGKMAVMLPLVTAVVLTALPLIRAFFPGLVGCTV